MQTFAALAAFRDSFSALAVNDSHPAKASLAAFLESCRGLSGSVAPFQHAVRDECREADQRQDQRGRDCDVAQHIALPFGRLIQQSDNAGGMVGLGRECGGGHADRAAAWHNWRCVATPRMRSNGARCSVSPEQRITHGRSYRAAARAF